MKLRFVAWLACLGLAAGFARPASAFTIHRSFRTREAGFGFGTGRATVAYPVDAKVDKALDEAAEKEAERVKVVIGRCTSVKDGNTINVVTGGNVKYRIRLDRIAAPGSDQPFGKESAACLASLVRGKTVRVEWQKATPDGCVLGIVYASGKKDVNLHLVATGHARHRSDFDSTPAYAAAESSAKERKLGLWGGDGTSVPRREP